MITQLVYIVDGENVNASYPTPDFDPTYQTIAVYLEGSLVTHLYDSGTKTVTIVNGSPKGGDQVIVRAIASSDPVVDFTHKVVLTESDMNKMYAHLLRRISNIENYTDKTVYVDVEEGGGFMLRSEAELDHQILEAADLALSTRISTLENTLDPRYATPAQVAQGDATVNNRIDTEVNPRIEDVEDDIDEINTKLVANISTYKATSGNLTVKGWDTVAEYTFTPSSLDAQVLVHFDAGFTVTEHYTEESTSWTETGYKEVLVNGIASTDWTAGWQIMSFNTTSDVVIQFRVNHRDRTDQTKTSWSVGGCLMQELL